MQSKWEIDENGCDRGLIFINEEIRMRILRVCGLMLSLILAAGSLRAHFVWVALETKDGKDPQAHVYFGESAEPDSAQFLDGLTRLKAWHRTAEGEYTPLSLHKVETDDGGLLTSDLPSLAGSIEADCLYGVFSHGDKALLLHYYAKSLRWDVSDPGRRSEKLDFDVAPQLKNGEMLLSVSWKGKPIEGSQVIVVPPKGERLELKTDAGGIATLQAPTPGRYEIRARRIDKKSGEFHDQKYDEMQYYSTVTFDVGASDAGRLSTRATSSPAKSTGYVDLPRGITSFGAAVIGDWLYVYGGHFGRPHHYSNTSQSDELSRLHLRNPAKWEMIAQGPRLQGLAMVAHGGKLYRMGGFTAHNQEDQDHDLRSVADFVRFDPQTKQWESLPPLPEPRSSHDAVVIQDKLYVVGGWKLNGEKEQQWHQTAWVADLSQESIVWKQVPKPPFQRRALSLGHLDGKLYVIGGMQEKGGPTTRVDVFDPASETWSHGPSLIDPLADAKRGKGMEGFGASAYTVGGQLVVSTYGGNVQVLDRDKKTWRIAIQLEDDRFFHRMLPFDSRLLLVGGASMRSGKRLHFETVKLSSLK